MDDVRSWWEVPSIAHFCSLFRSAFDLTDFDIEDLEDALLESEMEDGSAFLLDLVCRLLNGCYGRQDVTVANFDLYVKDIIKYKWDASDSPIKEKSEFKTLLLREKVELIHAICEYRLDTEDVIEELKGFEGDSMRVEPLGKDKDGAQFWYFYGSRLYMEDPEQNKELTKEESRAKDRQKRIEAKKKKQEEKRDKKVEKRKAKVLRKVERKKKEEEMARNQKREEETNTRRSGRLRNKKQEIPESESSASSSSSSEEEAETDESSQEDTMEEETVVKKSGRRPTRKTPTRTPTKKEATNQRAASTKKETTAKATRSSSRKSLSAEKLSEMSRTPDHKPPQTDTGSRRSSRIRKQPEPLPPTSQYNSDTEEENDYDVDSGHESAGSVRSEMSKVSARSSTDKSVQPVRSSSRRPTVNVDLKRDPSHGKDDAGEEKESGGCEADDGKEENKIVNDAVVNERADEIDDGCDNGEGKAEHKSEDTKDTKTTTDVKAITSEVTKDELTNEIEKKDEEHCDANEQTMNLDTVKTSTEDSDNKNIKAETVEGEKTANSENVETEITEDCVKDEIDDQDLKQENVEIKPEPEEELSDNMEIDTDTRRTLRKKNTEAVESESVKNNDVKEESKVNKEVKCSEFSLSRPAVAPRPSKSSTRWHLVCETLDDWINFAEWFKVSETKCERALSKVIREDFLPVLSEIIEAREKEKQRRLLQEQELRRSNRITMKMKERMEQEKILAEALAEEEKAKIKAEEERKLNEEQLRLEEENRQREERFKAREERSRRQSMREERARLLAEGKEIPPEMIYTGTTQKKDDGEDSDDSRCDLKTEEDFGALGKVINAMKYHKDCWPFLEPVTDEQAPGYSDVIKRPMDLSKIDEKVERREYRSSQHFLSDFRLMFNNCKRFNGQDSEFSDCARSMENMLKKYMKRFVSDEPTDKYYDDKPFMVAGRVQVGEKRYRPQRAASSRALQTVHNALNSDDDETDSDEEDLVPVRKKTRDASDSPFKTQSHHNLLLQEMIELKRQREKKLAASALHNHGVITRGPERIRVQNPEGGGVMIIPKGEMDATGVLKMSATREIKRKVSQQQLPNLTPMGSRLAKLPVVHNLGNHTVLKADLTKKDPGLSIIDQTAPGSTQPKTIRIVASNANGQPSVKQTAENVKVSSDGYLIISGKNSGIKVTENTKIVIQPPGATPQNSESPNIPQGVGREIFIKKIPTPYSLKQLPGLSLASTSATATNPVAGSPSATPLRPGQIPAQTSAAQLRTSQVPAQSASRMLTQQQINLKELLRQTAAATSTSQQQANIQGLMKQIGDTGPLTQEMKKKLDIAQRILLLNQQKRKLLDQQKVQQQQPMNAASPAVNTAKIIKLEPRPGASNSSAIEERLRDPSISIDNRLGSVSQNVISNVNIASDILDTYYSVLNDAKSKSSVQNSSSVSITVPQSTRPVVQNTSTPQVIANTNLSQNQASIPGTIEQPIAMIQNSNSQNTNTQNTKPVAMQGNISEVTRQIYNMINKSGSGGLVSAFARAQLTKQNVPAVLSQVSSVQNKPAFVQMVSVSSVQMPSVPSVQAPVCSVQMPSISSVQIPSESNIQLQSGSSVQIPSDPSQRTSISISDPVSMCQSGLKMQSTCNLPLTSNSSISDLLRSSLARSETRGTEKNPIETLFAKTTPVKTGSENASKSPLVQALTSHITPINVNSISSAKNTRQNLFDAFEANQLSVVTTVSGNDFGFASPTASPVKSEMPKEIKMKLRAEGISLPASSTLNFGPPLKTSSVLKALKCKLHTVKPQTEMSDTSYVVGDGEEPVDKYAAPTSAFSSMPIDSRIMLPMGSGSLLHASIATCLIPNSASLHHGVVNTSMPSVTSTNIQQGTIPLLVAEENVNVLLSGQHVQSSMNAMQANVQTSIMPLMPTDCVNIPQVSGVQMLTSPGKAPQISGNQMLSRPGQGSIQQAPIQVPQSVLQAIQQATGGIALNEGAQNALLQQLNAIVNNRQSNQQIGVQNSSVVNNFQHMNPSLITLPGTQLSYTPSPVRTQSLPVVLQPSQQNIEVQSVPQLSGICSVTDVQNASLGHVEMEFVSENEVFDANNSYSANINEMATKLVKSDSVEFNNDYMNEVCLANTVDNITSSNIALLNQTGTVISGNVPHTSLLLNLAGTEAMDTSLDANTLMMKTTDQSIENQEH